jgi:serine/threonine protein kinase
MTPRARLATARVEGPRDTAIGVKPSPSLGDAGGRFGVGSPPDMAGTSAPRVPHCRDLTPLGERLASTLYTARSDRLGHPVTVTVYPTLEDEQARRRFDGAATGAQRLAAHPNVLAIHDWGHADDGRPWVVTDPRPAETIDTLLRTQGPLAVEQALRIGVLVAGALETAHRAGVVHGDLSPARLVFDPQGEPLVADIGIAEFSDFPGFGALHNPIRYFAPPEVLERTGLTPASDAYSLAATLYGLLTGGAPHEKPADITDSNASLLLRILQIHVPPIVRPGEDIEGVEAAIVPALAHAAERRPPVLDVAWSLQAVQRRLGLTLVEPVVLDLGNPRHPTPLDAELEEARAAPQEPDEVPSWYAGSQPGPAAVPGTAGTPGPRLVHLFSDTPPDFTNRGRDATAPRWATGLGHADGPAPATGRADRAGGMQPRPEEPRRPAEPGPPPRPRRPSQPHRPEEPRRPMEPYRPHDPYSPDEPHPPAAAGRTAWAPSNGHRSNGHVQARPLGAGPAPLDRPGDDVGRAATTRNDGEPGRVQRPPTDRGPGPEPPGQPARHHDGPPGGEPRRPVIGSHTPVGANTAPTARGPSAVPAIVPRDRRSGEPATRPGPSPEPGRHGQLGGTDVARSGAFPAGERTRTGSALERARQARMRRYAASGAGRPDPDDREATPRVADASPPAGGALAAPVIVLIVVVVLLTLGVAYMVITGDGTSKPVDEQPGASTPSVPTSMHQT